MTATSVLNADQLRRIVNASGYPSPLAHSHALEIVAQLHQARDWNSLAALATAKELPQYKAVAKTLRATMNLRGLERPLSSESAERVCSEMAALTGKATAPASERWSSTAAPLVSFTPPTKPKMDDLLRFLDVHRVYLGNLILDQTDGWATRDCQKQAGKIRKRYERAASNIVTGAEPLVPELREKAHRVAQALASTPIPALLTSGPSVTASGTWHKYIRAVRDKDVMVDYELVLTGGDVRYSDAGFRKLLLADRPKESHDGLFESWLVHLDESACASPDGKRWSIEADSQSAEVYVVCLPMLNDVSSVIKRLRPLTERYAGQVFVCSPAGEQLQTLFEQGIGTIHFPSREVSTRGLRQPSRHAENLQRDWEPWYYEEEEQFW